MIFKRQEATALHQKWYDTGSISRAEAVQYFSYVRFVLERAKPIGKVPTLSTYCDWLAHESLNRSKHFGPLKRATILLSKGGSLPDPHDDIVNGFLNTHVLVREMQQFNMHYAVGTLEGELEARLLLVLSEELMEKPISCFIEGAKVSWAIASTKLGLQHDLIVFSGRILRSHTLEDDGAYNVSLELQTVRKNDDQTNFWQFPYAKLFADSGKVEIDINLDANKHPMYHTHPMFAEVGHI